MGRELIGVQVLRCINQDLIDRVDMDVLRGNVPEIDLVDTGAVLHVEGHARRSGDIRSPKGRVFFKCHAVTGFTREFFHLCKPAAVHFLHPLHNFKQSCTPGNAIRFQGRRDCKADCLLCSGNICNNEIRRQRIQSQFNGFHRGIERLQINRDIHQFSPISFLKRSLFLYICFLTTRYSSPFR